MHVDQSKEREREANTLLTKFEIVPHFTARKQQKGNPH